MYYYLLSLLIKSPTLFTTANIKYVYDVHHEHHLHTHRLGYVSVYITITCINMHISYVTVVDGHEHYTLTLGRSVYVHVCLGTYVYGKYVEMYICIYIHIYIRPRLSLLLLSFYLLIAKP
jgi:hypothetical protein